jgi:hypothetical protein
MVEGRVYLNSVENLYIIGKTVLLRQGVRVETASPVGIGKA